MLTQTGDRLVINCTPGTTHEEARLIVAGVIEGLRAIGRDGANPDASDGLLKLLEELLPTDEQYKKMLME